ncbi:penicillin-binding protein, partial [Escherichia coli]
DFLFDTCSCQTARCFNKSKGVLITGLKLKAFRNPQPSWGFSVHKKMALLKAPFSA